MSAAEVIAQEVWQAYVVELGRSLPEGLADKMAAGVVPALKAAGYAVVELRQPNTDGHWSIRVKNDLRVEDGMVMQVLPKSSGMTVSESSPRIVRLVAGALLAAADAAEVSDV